MATILGFISMFKTGRMERGGPSNICPFYSEKKVFLEHPLAPPPVACLTGQTCVTWPPLAAREAGNARISLWVFFSLDNGSRQKGRKWKCTLVWPANGICRRTPIPISPPFHVVLEQLPVKVPSPSTTFSSKKGALVLKEPGMRDGWP